MWSRQQSRPCIICTSATWLSAIFAADVLLVKSTKFALLYVALEAAEPGDKIWRVKPKLHMLLEVCAEGSKPATFWSYRDEDYGGIVAKMSRRRRGLLSIASCSSNVLNRFKMATPVIRMVANV